MINTEKIGSFNPFEMDGFSCPVCESNEFVELWPYGGVWCARCNASFEVGGTCDGPRKLAVHCVTKHCHSREHREKADRYFTVIWDEDNEIGWFAVKDRKIIQYP